jgi:ectoine hydroxylase-related dioxygenase (phytanoyl-CoA dioxygenase family)
MDETVPPARLSALRAEFGDPKPLNISRKITAYVSCRKQKTNLAVDTATSENGCLEVVPGSHKMDVPFLNRGQIHSN